MARDRAGSIVLVGFMGSGKTEVGRRLAALTGRPFVDTDDLVERSAGVPVGELFERQGEAGFRSAERRAVRGLSSARGAIVSTGGGVVLDPDNVADLRRLGTVVYLRARPAALARRLRGDTTRPLLRGAGEPLTERVRTILAQREAHYEAAADHIVDAGRLGPDELAAVVLQTVNGDSAVPASPVRVDLAPGYDIHVGRGILADLAALAGDVGTPERVVVVTHPRIRTAWRTPVERGLRPLRATRTWVTVPDGERSKSIGTFERVLRALARARVGRGDLLIALGGGVIGDLTGFAAASYARGVRYVQVPTTLLAMVDSAIGGKTGINLPEGKNLVGAFHHPTAVVADLDTLSTLRARTFREGLAEVVKYALIDDPAIGRLIVQAQDVRNAAVVEQIVLRSAGVKARVVAADEREHGLRTILNYGHTLGHALETVVARTGGRIAHGEAVAVGMVYAAHLAVLEGIAEPSLVDRHLELLHAARLPVAAPKVSWTRVRAAIEVDKKRAAGSRFVLLRAPGRPVVHTGIAERRLARAWQLVSEG